MAKPSASSVLTVRVSSTVSRRLAREARRRRRTRSDVARSILEAALVGTTDEDPRAEARRQSLLVSRRKSERDALGFLEDVATDPDGWR